MAATHAEEMQRIRLECDRKLADQMHKSNEERANLIQSHQNRLSELRDSLASKEKQWKQQIKASCYSSFALVIIFLGLFCSKAAGMKTESYFYCLLDIHYSYQSEDCDQIEHRAFTR